MTDVVRESILGIEGKYLPVDHLFVDTGVGL
jgi:hypothetical protein